MSTTVKDWLSSPLHELKGLSGRAALHQGLNFLLVLGSALAIWKGLMTSSASESPIVVVLSGSMEPAYYRGDLLFLWNDHSVPLEVGEVMVFKLDGRDTPIVHRILEVRDEGVRVDDTLGSEVRMLTKGDNNEVDDRGLYNRGQVWLSRRNIIGRARFFLPYVGMITILMNDYPFLKIVMVAIMGLFVLLSKDSL